MTTNEPSGHEGTDDEPTTDERRARWERFTIIVLDGEGGGHINIRNNSHENPNDHIHTVHVEDGSVVGCSCPHAVYRDAHCKHQIAVEQRPLVVSSAAAAANASAADASAATTGQQVATDGGTQQVAHTDASDTDDDGEDSDDEDTTSDDDQPQADYWGNAVEHFDDGPVGAGEKSECQSCGSRFKIALVAATEDSSNQNWEEFYRCEACGATGSFRFYGKRETDRREWTGRIAYPEGR